MSTTILLSIMFGSIVTANSMDNKVDGCTVVLLSNRVVMLSIFSMVSWLEKCYPTPYLPRYLRHPVHTLSSRNLNSICDVKLWLSHLCIDSTSVARFSEASMVFSKTNRVKRPR